jgi:formate dehydrogenase maturation protein FdhE
MTKKQQISPIKYMSNEVFKSSLFFKKDNKYYLNNSISPLAIPHIHELFNENVHIRYFDPDVQYCPVCGSKFSLNGTVSSKVNKLKDVRMQQYICSNPDCGETYYTKLKDKNHAQCSFDL